MRLFGTDGVRAVGMTELPCKLAYDIGMAAVNVCGGEGKILIAKDTRLSSDVLEAAISAGVACAGGTAIIAGVLPTPAAAYLTKSLGYDGAVMITASHNTFEYNGIKIFGRNGFKLPDETEDRIERMVRSGDLTPKSGAEIGRITRLEDAKERYVSFLKGFYQRGEKKLKFLVDCSNGSASATARDVFGEDGVLGGTDIIHDSPNGVNVNHNCGSTHIDLLTERVVSGGYDAGIAFDGDADRCLAVTGKGEIVDGDKIIALVAGEKMKRGELMGGAVVVTVMSNLGFREYMRKCGVKVISARVGDKYVLQEMLRRGYTIGGEQSGHVIFSEYATTGDGQLTAAILLNTLSRSDKTLSELIAEIPEFPQVSIGVAASPELRSGWLENDEITSAIAAAEGELNFDGRVLVRASGTEPLIRVMVEGRDAARVKRLAGSIADTIKKESHTA